MSDSLGRVTKGPPCACLPAVASIVLEISGEILDALRLPEGRAREELHREFAVFLVKEGLLPRAKARLALGMERLEFEDLLARRHVHWEGTVEEILAEVDAAELLTGRKE